MVEFCRRRAIWQAQAEKEREALSLKLKEMDKREETPVKKKPGRPKKCP